MIFFLCIIWSANFLSGGSKNALFVRSLCSAMRVSGVGEMRGKWYAHRQLVEHLSVKGTKNIYGRIQRLQLLLVRKLIFHWITVVSIWKYLHPLIVGCPRTSDPMLSPHTCKNTLSSYIFKSLAFNLTLIVSRMKFMYRFSATLSKTKTKLNLERRRTKP